MFSLLISCNYYNWTYYILCHWRLFLLLDVTFGSMRNWTFIINFCHSFVSLLHYLLKNNSKFKGKGCKSPNVQTVQGWANLKTIVTIPMPQIIILFKLSEFDNMTDAGMQFKWLKRAAEMLWKGPIFFLLFLLGRLQINCGWYELTCLFSMHNILKAGYKLAAI